MWHVWGSGEVRTRLLSANLTEKDHMEDQGVDESIILSWIFRNRDGVDHGLQLQRSSVSEDSAGCRKFV